MENIWGPETLFFWNACTHLSTSLRIPRSLGHARPGRGGGKEHPGGRSACCECATPPPGTSRKRRSSSLCACWFLHSASVCAHQVDTGRCQGLAETPGARRVSGAPPCFPGSPSSFKVAEVFKVQQKGNEPFHSGHWKFCGSPPPLIYPPEKLGGHIFYCSC